MTMHGRWPTTGTRVGWPGSATTIRRSSPEFELVHTGVFHDGRHWEITADYAKTGPLTA